jgi:purine-binding chemotaxis protein CheW
MKGLGSMFGESANNAGREDGDAADVLSLCSLMAGGRLFGIDTRTIREVLGKGSLNRVPLAPLYVGGVIAYRGEVVTAVSLRALLGLEPAEGKSCVLVLDGDVNEERFGLMVDSVGGVVKVSRRLAAANPSTLDEASKALFIGAFRTDEGLLVQLNPDRLKPSRLAETGLFGQPPRIRGVAADRRLLERMSNCQGE